MHGCDLTCDEIEFGVANRVAELWLVGLVVGVKLAEGGTGDLVFKPRNMDLGSVPGLLERFGLRFPGEPI